MYRVNASCECGWFKDYQISGPVAQMELKAAHDEFVMNEESMPVHEAPIAHSSDRVLLRSDRSRNEMKTVGWKTRCSCGEMIETKNNSIKTHTAKVQRHLVKAGA